MRGLIPIQQRTAVSIFWGFRNVFNPIGRTAMVREVRVPGVTEASAYSDYLQVRSLDSHVQTTQLEHSVGERSRPAALSKHQTIKPHQTSTQCSLVTHLQTLIRRGHSDRAHVRRLTRGQTCKPFLSDSAFSPNLLTKKGTCATFMPRGNES